MPHNTIHIDESLGASRGRRARRNELMHLHKPSAGSVITKITIPASLSLCFENAWPPDSVHGTTSLELTHVLCSGHRLIPAFAWYNPQALNQSWVHLLRCVSVAALGEPRPRSVPGFDTEMSKTDVRPLVTLVGIATRQCCLASLSRLRNGHKACRWIASLLLKHNAVFCRFRGTNHERQLNTHLGRLRSSHFISGAIPFRALAARIRRNAC